MKTIKILLIPFIIFFSTQILADKRCLKGKNPSQEEIIKIKLYNTEFQKELEELSILINKDPENIELQNKFKQKNDILWNKVTEVAQISETITIEENLENCTERMLSNEQFRETMDNWYLMLTHNPKNHDYAYNVKLLNTLMLSRL